MIITFRWYGNSDSIKLGDIRQIPVVKGIVSALYDIPVGDVWPLEKLLSLRNETEANGLKLTVIESIPVHEDIKLGRASAARLTENYCESIRNMGRAGIPTLCYNFMPVFDWTRSNMALKLEDGSNALGYDNLDVLSTDLSDGTKDLPGWSASYSSKELKSLFDAYKELSSAGLWENFAAFIRKTAPVAEEFGIKMGIHPDDPPWPIFGLPRIITDETALDRLIHIYDSPSNGLTLCTGSLGASRGNDVVKLVDKYAQMGRITFAHVRNIKITGDGQFNETAHNTESGSLDILGIMKALKKAGFSGPLRPDHGRMIWGESGKPGYGLYDRALGAMYLAGLWEGLE